ncbi:MAG: [protein-PII] uridylyltransferase [Deltaproteobacteria bacterium]|nr:[protein-PII] uridylyltransferase [Deltaproteobacteria bacterium]
MITPETQILKLLPLEPKNYARQVAVFELKTDQDLLPQCQEFVEQARTKLNGLIAQNISSVACHHIRSLIIDKLVQNLFEYFHQQIIGQPAKQGHCVLFATGGYGRQEMAMYSDIDLLLCFDKADNRFSEMMEKMLYLLWDLGLEVGHALRDLSESKDLMKADVTIMSSMLDARVLCGSSVLGDRVYKIRDDLLRQDSFRKRFFQDKVEERKKRLKKYGGSVYVLEPNIKEGEGGLRDLHLMRWIGQILGLDGSFASLSAKGFIEKDVQQFCEQALEFYFYVRNQLHRRAKRKADQIGFVDQIDISELMGLQDSEDERAVEKFMQCYYETAATIHSATKNLIQKAEEYLQGRINQLVSNIKTKAIDKDFCIVNNRIALKDKDLFLKNPLAMMTVFRHVQSLGLGLHFSTKELLRKHLATVDDDYRANPDVCALLKEIMSDYHNLQKPFFAMHEVHFFEAILPEFKRLRSKTQHDVYHVYTVDTHSIFALEQLALLHEDHEHQKRFPVFYEALSQVKRRDLLAFGVLFHDIGKGKGGSHSVIGAQIANQIMTRLGYSDEEKEAVEFLVLSHLIMPHLSQRRDLEDLQMVREFSVAMKNLDRLNMLFVLVWADIRAVSAEAWTEWKGSLLIALYSKTVELMKASNASEDYLETRVEHVRAEILKRIPSSEERGLVQTFIESISPRYVFAHDDEEILEHFELIKNHDDSRLLFEEREHVDAGISEILLYALTNPRLVPLVTGVMLAHRVNILSLENFVMSDGHVLIKMNVQSSDGQSLGRTNLLDRVRKSLHDVFVSKANVDDLIAKSRPPSYMQKNPVQEEESKVQIDNDVSAYYTVIDIFTHDRVGLLYEIITCLSANGCYVEVSKISTKVDQVVDTFYVKDIFGHKITNKQKLNEIQARLIDVITGQGAWTS